MAKETFDEARRRAAYEELRESQKRVLSRNFRRQAWRLKKFGTMPDSGIANQEGGCFIVFRHSPHLVTDLYRSMRTFATLQPMSVYESSAIHTTIASFGLRPHYFASFEGENGLREKIRRDEAVGLLVKTIAPWAELMKNSPRCRIEYKEVFVNRTSVILAGEPSPEFSEIRLAILDSARRWDLPVLPSWGCHITLGRFTKADYAPSKKSLARLRKHIFSRGPLVSKPNIIDVAHGGFNDTEFHLHTAARFFLRE